MADSKPKQYKNDSKKRVKNYLYYKRSNVSYPNYTVPAGQRYLLEFNTLADYSQSLVSVFLLFSHSIYQIDPYINKQVDPKTLKFNLLFQYMVELYHLHDKYIPATVKTTEEQLLNLQEILGNKYFSYIHEDELKKQIKKLNEKCKKKVNQEYKSMPKQYASIKKVRLLKQSLKQRYQKEIFAITEQKRREIYIPQTMELISQLYIKNILKTLMNIQFTKKSYRRIKMLAFTKAYKDLWQTEFPAKQKYDGVMDMQKITLKRYTFSKESSSTGGIEVLMNLNNLVDLRKKEINYNDLDIEIIRQLGNELIRHEKKTKNHYPQLHPKFVVFNQLTLRTRLSYQAPLLAALGLLKMPCSIEQSLTYVATPQPFDQFSAPIQHINYKDEQQQGGTADEIFYDLLYGMDYLLDEYDDKYKHKKISKPVKEQIYMSDIKTRKEKASEAWRFVMIGSYLFNRKEYYKEFTNPVNDYPMFKKFLGGELQKSKKMGFKKYVSSVLGQNFMQTISAKQIDLRDCEELSLSIFDDLFGVKEQISQISVTSRFLNVNSMITWKKKIRGDILEVLLKNKEENKVINIVKYINIFYLSLFESMFHIKIICQYCLKDLTKGRELLKALSKDIKIDEFDENEDRDTYFQKTYAKIKQFQDKYRNKPTENMKYIIKNYQQPYKNAEINRQSFFSLKKQFKLAVFNSQGENINGTISKILEQSTTKMKIYYKYSVSFLQKQFMLTTEVASEYSKYSLFLYFFHLKIRLFLQLTNENYANIEPLILPILAMQKQKQSVKHSICQLIDLAQYALQILKDIEEKENNESSSPTAKSSNY